MSDSNVSSVPAEPCEDCTHDYCRCVERASKPQKERVRGRDEPTHGRHCRCTPCKTEDWTQPHLAPCGMHGPSCPPVYDPWPKPESNQHISPRAADHARELIAFQGEPKVIGQWFASARSMARDYLDALSVIEGLEEQLDSLADVLREIPAMEREGYNAKQLADYVTAALEQASIPASGPEGR